MTEHKTQEQPAPKRHRLDLRKTLEQLSLHGPSAQALLDSGRKDIEALLAANERVFTGVEALSQKQAELLIEIMREWQAGAKDVIGKGSSSEKVNQAAAHAQHAFTHALTSMKEMADIAAKAHEDVLNILNQRYQENIESFRQKLQKASRG